MDITLLLQKNFVRDLVQSVCGDTTELITRPASYIVRSKIEGDRDIQRIIVLPPRGYTADKINQTNSHDEAEFATVQIKGAVREDKSGFSKLHNCLFMASIPENGKTSELNKPYLLYEVDGDDSHGSQKTLHSSGAAPFAVVKKDGYGFYHNLVNLTDDWLVLQLYKRLRPQKGVNLEPFFKNMSPTEVLLLSNLYRAVVEYGDEIFYKTPDLLERVYGLSLSSSLPALCEMLYIRDTGKHEACSIFAVILKIGRSYPMEVREFLKSCLELKAAPAYYVQQLIIKIDRFGNQDKVNTETLFSAA